MVVDANNFLIRNMGGQGFRTTEGNVLKTSTGIETGMLLGAINSFVALQNRFTPSHTIFCFDAGRSTYRLGIRAAYKSNRDKSPDPINQYDLKPQFGFFQEFLDTIGVQWTRQPGVEADDFIATIVKMAVMPSVVVSADHDLLQLVDDKVSVLKPAQGKSEEVLFTSDKVFEKYGLTPQQLPKMWAIMGDTGDGVSGIPGVGPVTATKWIQKYNGQLFDILFNEPKANTWMNHVMDNLRMIRLDGSVAEPYITDDLEGHFTPCYSDELREFFMRFELNSLVRKLDQGELWKDRSER